MGVGERRRAGLGGHRAGHATTCGLCGGFLAEVMTKRTLEVVRHQRDICNEVGQEEAALRRKHCLQVVEILFRPRSAGVVGRVEGAVSGHGGWVNG